MDKIKELLKKLGIELTADQTKQLEEVIGKEFVSAEDASTKNTELEDLKKQLEKRDADIEKLQNDTTSEELKKQLEELREKYKTETDELNGKLAQQRVDFAAESFLSGFKFASERVKKSVAADFKAQGFKLGEDGKFIGGEEYMKKLQTDEPDAFAQEKRGIFMDSTASGVSPDSNNTEAQIFKGFGLNSK